MFMMDILQYIRRNRTPNPKGTTHPDGAAARAPRVKARFPTTRTMCLIATLTTSSVYSFQVTHEGDVILTASDLAGGESNVAPISPSSRIPYKLYVYVYSDMHGNPGGAGACGSDGNLEIPHKPAYDYEKNNNSLLKAEIRKALLDRVTVMNRSCLILTDPPAKKVTFNIITSLTTTGNVGEGTHRGYWQFTHPITPILPHEPCSSSVGTVSFGTIAPSTRDLVKTTTVEVLCPQSSTVRVTTNHGQPLTDAVSGSTLRFDDPGAQTCDSCRLPIVVHLQRGPLTAGAYRWQVPVVVEYQ